MRDRVRLVRRVGVALLAGIAWVASGCGDAEAPRVASLAPDTSDRSSLEIPVGVFAREFDDIVDTIDAHYALAQSGGVDVPALRTRFGPEIDRAADAGEFYSILLRVFAALHNSHSGPLLPSSAFLDAGFESALVEDRVCLTGVFADRTLADLGMGRGWQITAIDATPVAEWLERRGQDVSASTSQFRRVAAARFVGRRYWFEPAERLYRIVSPQGTALDVRLRLDRRPDTPPAALVTRETRGDVGYVAVNGLSGDVVSLFESALGQMTDARALVLDLRRNGGGSSQLGHPIIAHLIDRPARVVLPPQTLEPHPTLRFRGPLAVLIGPATHSAAESLAHNLHDAGRGTFLGGPTAGSSGSGPKIFRTPNGVVFRLPTRVPDRSPSGVVMEGAGLAPDVLVSQTFDDFLAGRDTVLERAERLLRY